jgi:eukaryotic-like serine/threonine-protein kinase
MNCPNCHHENPDDSVFCGKCGSRYDHAVAGSFTKTVETPGFRWSPGAVFAGRYEMLEELGRGGMGIVYKAVDKKLKRTVALKFLPWEWTSNPQAKERFAREAQAAAALDHPHICTVHEIDEAEGRMFISMAFVEGETLKTRIARGPLKIEESLDLALQVAEGLREAHAKGIVHRDIKSANIMVMANGQAKIMDFGLARISGGTQLTAEPKTMGTIAYMSPEQSRGETVDHRTDLWSLGVVLYEMVGGRLPFAGEHDLAVMHSILKDEPRPLSAVRPGVPESIETVIERAMEKDPAARYASAEEMIADLKAVSEGLAPARPKRRRKKPSRRKARKVLWAAGLAGALILAAAAGIIVLSGRTRAVDSIAVLPLENLSGDPGQEYFSEGIHEALITDLGRLSGLKRVIARSSVMRFKGSKASLNEIARQLGVARLITGSVVRAGERVRVTAQLVDPATEAQLWAKSYENDIRDVLSLQNEIVSAIMGEIQVQLSAQDKARLARARRVDPAAYDACLKGRYEWYKLSRDGLDEALRLFTSALEHDPEYAPAYAGIATVWEGYMQQGFIAPSEATPKAKAAALKALQLDDSLAEIQFILAGISTWVDWDWLGAERAFRRAIELNPKYPEPRIYYSQFLYTLQRPQEAIVQAERALELDPLNPLFQGLYAMDLLYAHRYDDAIARLRDTLAKAPGGAIALSTLRTAYHMKRMDKEALEIWTASYEAKGDHEAVQALAAGFKEGGYSAALRRVAEMFVARSKTAYVTPWQIATLYTRAGDRREALDWLEKAYEIRDLNMPYISIDPIFEFLRSEPRFRDLLKRMKLPN